MQTTPQAEPISKSALWAGWIMSGLIIAFMLFDGAIKLVPLEIVITTGNELGLPANVARTLGVIGLTCTVLYAYPRTSILGAILLTGYMGGAIATHLRVGSPLFSHTLFGVYLGLMIWGGIWLRDSRLSQLIPLRRN